MEKHLQGIWHCVASERDGVRYSKQQIAERGRYVLVVDSSIPGWNGIWGIVKYGHSGGRWPDVAVEASCRHIILGTVPSDEPPADFYLFAGGRYRIAPQEAPKEIDFEQYWRGEVIPSSMNLGIYKLEGDRLILCFGGSANARPSSFTSVGHADRFLDELARSAAPS